MFPGRGVGVHFPVSGMGSVGEQGSGDLDGEDIREVQHGESGGLVGGGGLVGVVDWWDGQWVA